MDTKQIEKLLRNLGYTYDALVSNGIIEKLELQKLYDTEETLEISLAPGVELVFWSETRRLEMIEFRLDPNGECAFRAALPAPLNIISNQTDTRALLGRPLYSLSQMELLATELYGWDTYQLDDKLHPEAFLEVQYDSGMNVSCIMISLMDKNI